MKKIDAYNFKETILSNGLKIYYSYLPYATRTVFYAAMNSGSLSGKRGAAHFLEHLLIDETEKFKNDKEFDLHFQENAGGRIDLFTNYYFTAFGVSINSKKTSKALVNIEELFLKPKISANNFEREKKVIFEEIHDRIPREKIIQNYEYITNLLFDKEKYSFLHNLVHPHVTLGSPEEIQMLTLNDLVEHYNEFYSVNNLTIFVGSDKPQKEIIKEIKEVFSKYKKNKKLISNKHKEKKLEKVIYKTKYIENNDSDINERKQKTSELSFDYTYLAKDKKFKDNFYITKLCLYEKFFELVRNQNGLAYNPYINLNHNKWYVNFEIGLETSSKDLDLCKKLIFSAIDLTIKDKKLFEKIKKTEFLKTANNESVPEIVSSAMHSKMVYNFFLTLEN